MSPGSLPIYGADDNPHSASPPTTIAIPAKTRLFPIGAIAMLTQHRLYLTGGPGNTRPPCPDARRYAWACACDLAPAASRAAIVSLMIFSASGPGAPS